MDISQMSLVTRDSWAWASGPAASCQALANWSKKWDTPGGGVLTCLLAAQLLCQSGPSLTPLNPVTCLGVIIS